MFSDGFSEGQTRDINEGFPSESNPYADQYDYLSDSDLEDESLCSEGEGEEPFEEALDPTTSHTVASDLQSSVETREAQNNDRLISFTIERFPIFSNPSHRPDDNPTRMGKFAIIRDMGAVTCVRYSLRQLILAPYGLVAALRRCYISYTLARLSLPRSVQIPVTTSLHRQGSGNGAQGNCHLHQQSQFID